MELTPIYKRVIGLDVHQAQISACAIVEQADGSATLERLMESTGIYWKSPFAALETVGIVAWVVNARHSKRCRVARPM